MSLRRCYYFLSSVNKTEEFAEFSNIYIVLVVIIFSYIVLLNFVNAYTCINVVVIVNAIYGKNIRCSLTNTNRAYLKL
jgi:hypothetical protein